MKILSHLLLGIFLLGSARASSVSFTSVSTQSITIPGSRYTLDFGVRWSCDDSPQNSAPGRIELLDGGGTLVGRVIASVYWPGNISVAVSGAGSVSNAVATVTIYAPNGTPADGGMSGTWNISVAAPGNYTLRFYNVTTAESTLGASTVWTDTYSNGGSAPPPDQFTLGTAAGAGGSVSPGGTFAAGSIVTVTATPDAAHDFAGWSGDAAGPGNPVSVTLDGNKAVQANFTLKTFALTTSASAGGSVTPGGTYPAGTTVTIAASPDATHRFVGWSGDASGTASPVAITLDRAKNAQALFTGKAAQAITFNPPGDHGNGAAPFGLSASASSGLAVTFTVVSGPATISNNMVQVTGPGTVSIRASQTGDGSFLPAAPVTQSFNVIAAVALKYRGSVRPLLKSKRTPAGAPFVIQLP